MGEELGVRLTDYLFPFGNGIAAPPASHLQRPFPLAAPTAAVVMAPPLSLTPFFIFCGYNVSISSANNGFRGLGGA